MANYINTNILTESYVNIDADYHSYDIQGMTDNLQSYVQHRSEHFMYPGVDTNLSFKEGSLKGYATIRGYLHKCISSDPKRFHDEIQALSWFVKRISDAIVMEMAFSSKSYYSSITHTEARPGLIGRAKHINDLILSIKSVDDEKSAKQVIKSIRRIKAAIERLLAAVLDNTDQNLLKNGFAQILKDHPVRFMLGALDDDKKEIKNEAQNLLDILTV